MATTLIQAGSPPQHATERTLDLLAVPAPLRDSAQGCGCGGVVTDTEWSKVKVTFVQVSPELFGAGDDIVFELLVENVGRLPVPIALTRDPDLAPSCHLSDSDVGTLFMLVAKNGNQLIGYSPRFSGSLAVAGTVMNLNAGERVRVRAPGTVYGTDQTPVASEDPQALQVEAHFSTQQRCASVSGRSQNALAVHVRRPR
jgi:hypothetical protein